MSVLVLLAVAAVLLGISYIRVCYQNIRRGEIALGPPSCTVTEVSRPGVSQNHRRPLKENSQ